MPGTKVAFSIVGINAIVLLKTKKSTKLKIGVKN